MTVLVDTSALYASLDRNDPDHDRARDTFANHSVHDLTTHSYVILETDALVRRRLGLRASRVLHETIFAPLDIVFVDAALHQAAVAAYLGSGKSGPSLVDCASFAVMRAHGIRAALAFDRHFAAAGFEVVP